MANKNGRSVRKKFRYFFINNELNKVLRKNRAEDLLVAWNFNQRRRMAYSWTDVHNNMQQAYSIKQVSQIFDRHPLTIHRWIRDGDIISPTKTYSLSGKEKYRGVYYFSEDDIRGIHDYLCSVSIGRPRGDGAVTNTRVPTRAELEAVLRRETILYVKDNAGEFVPVWKQPEWR
jgi:hypothetical protein